MHACKVCGLFADYISGNIDLALSKCLPVYGLSCTLCLYHVGLARRLVPKGIPTGRIRCSAQRLFRLRVLLQALHAVYPLLFP